MISKIFISFCIAIMVTLLSTMVSYADENEIKHHHVLNVDAIYWFGDNNFTLVTVDKANKRISFTKIPTLTGYDRVEVFMDVTGNPCFEYFSIYNKTTAVTYLKYIIHIRTLNDLRTGISGTEQKLINHFK